MYYDIIHNTKILSGLLSDLAFPLYSNSNFTSVLVLANHNCPKAIFVRFILNS